MHRKLTGNMIFREFPAISRSERHIKFETLVQIFMYHEVFVGIIAPINVQPLKFVVKTHMNVKRVDTSLSFSESLNEREEINISSP